MRSPQQRHQHRRFLRRFPLITIVLVMATAYWQQKQRQLRRRTPVNRMVAMKIFPFFSSSLFNLPAGLGGVLRRQPDFPDRPAGMIRADTGKEVKLEAEADPPATTDAAPVAVLLADDLIEPLLANPGSKKKRYEAKEN
jgi:hypothetical protein